MSLRGGQDLGSAEKPLLEPALGAGRAEGPERSVCTSHFPTLLPKPSLRVTEKRGAAKGVINRCLSCLKLLLLKQGAGSARRGSWPGANMRLEALAAHEPAPYDSPGLCGDTAGNRRARGVTGWLWGGR